MYPEVFKAREILKSDDFHAKLFDACIANYFDLNNPIRFNNFSYAIRELLREKLDKEAPEDDIKKTKWYIPNGEKKPTRSDRVRYYIVKGLINDNLSDETLHELDEILIEYKKLIEVLNKYTHINSASFGIELTNGDLWFRRIIKMLLKFVDIIDRLNEKVKTILLDKIQEDIQEKLILEIPNEIDVLSTHSYIDEVIVNKLEIVKMNYENIEISGDCDVGIELNYGSESDRREDGDEGFPVRYPMDFSVTININDLEKRGYEIGKIDTSGFYE